MGLQFEPIILGTPPNTSYAWGWIYSWSEFAQIRLRGRDQHLMVMDYLTVMEATITFETPAYKIDVCSQHRVDHPKKGILPDGFIDVYDTQRQLNRSPIDNLESSG